MRIIERKPYFECFGDHYGGFKIHQAYLVEFGRIWSYLVVFSRIWSYLVVFSRIWSYFVVFGRIWSSQELLESNFGIWGPLQKVLPEGYSN